MAGHRLWLSIRFAARPWRIAATREQRKRHPGEKLRLKRLGCGQHFLDMARHLDLAPYVADRALGVDQERRPLDPHIFSSVHAFLDPGAIGSADLSILIGGELEGQIILLLEP